MVNLARLFENEAKFESLKNSYPINGTGNDKRQSSLADSLRNKRLSAVRIDCDTIGTSVTTTK